MSARAPRAPAAVATRAVAAGLVVTAGAVALALSPGLPTLERHQLPKELALAAGGALLAALGAAAGRQRLDALSTALLGLGLLGAVAVPSAIDGDAALRMATVGAAGVAVAWALRHAPPAARRAAVAAGFAAATVGAAATVLEAYALLPRLSLDGYAPGALLGHRNEAAHVFAATLVAAAAWLALGEGRARLALPPAVALHAWALTLTRARSSWLGAATGLAVALLTGLALSSRAKSPATSARPPASAGPRPSPRRPAAPPLAATRRTRAARAGSTSLALLAVAAGAALPAWVRPALDWKEERPYASSLARLVDLSEGGSGRGRLVQWRASMALLAERPLLGVGAGQWAVHYPRVAPDPDPTQRPDDWLPTSRLLTGDAAAILVERGALGAALAALALALALAGWWRAARRGHVPVGDAAAALGALATVALGAALDCVVQTAVGAATAAWLVPPADPERAPASPPRSPEPPPRARDRWLAAFVASALALGLAVGVHGAHARWRLAVALESADVAATAALARAAPHALAPRLRLVDYHLFRGDCARARPWLAQLARARPYHRRIAEAARYCRAVP